jgi:hypothetical protein
MALPLAATVNPSRLSHEVRSHLLNGEANQASPLSFATAPLQALHTRIKPHCPDFKSSVDASRPIA